MKTLLIGGAIAALASGIAFAQPAPPPPPGVAQGTAPLPPRAPDDRMMMHVQVMSDHVMTRDEVVAHVRKMFERLDTNHDGYVTRDEANAFLGRMDGVRGRMEGMREHMDGMHEHMRNVRLRVENRIDAGGEDRGALFDRLDTNHDGVISREEFTRGREQMREKRMIVMRADTDGVPPVPPIPPIPAPPNMNVMHTHMMGDGTGGFGARLFDMADTNHDGRVSLQEAEAAALAHFDRADLNHDGRITPDERRQVREIRLERRPS